MSIFYSQYKMSWLFTKKHGSACLLHWHLFGSFWYFIWFSLAAKKGSIKNHLLFQILPKICNHVAEQRKVTKVPNDALVVGLICFGGRLLSGICFIFKTDYCIHWSVFAMIMHECFVHSFIWWQSADYVMGTDLLVDGYAQHHEGKECWAAPEMNVFFVWIKPGQFFCIVVD